MNEQDILDGAATALGEKGWCMHRLVDADGSHCALGAVGYARWGAEFDGVATAYAGPGSNGNTAAAYEMLKYDTQTREAIRVLAEQIRERRIPGLDHHLSRCGVDDDVRLVMAYNDNYGSGAGVMAAFTSAARRLADRVMAAFKPKQAEVKVEYHPVENKEEVNEVEEQAAR